MNSGVSWYSLPAWHDHYDNRHNAEFVNIDVLALKQQGALAGIQFLRIQVSDKKGPFVLECIHSPVLKTNFSSGTPIDSRVALMICL